jgi:hypothetical protein
VIAPFARASLAFFLATAVIALVPIAIAPLPEVRMFGLVAVLASLAGIAVNAIALGPEFRSAFASILGGARERARRLRAAAAQARQRQRDIDAVKAAPVA